MNFILIGLLLREALDRLLASTPQIIIFPKNNSFAQLRGAATPRARTPMPLQTKFLATPMEFGIIQLTTVVVWHFGGWAKWIFFDELDIIVLERELFSQLYNLLGVVWNLVVG